MANASDSNDGFITVEMNPSVAKPLRVVDGPGCEAELPTYEEATNPSTIPPPSYESLFGRVKEAHKSSKSILDFIVSLIILLVGTVGCSIVLVGTVAVPIGMIVMGSLYMYQCPQGENIPVYLLVGGLLGVLKELLHLTDKIRHSPEVDPDRIRHKPAHTLLFAFMVGWFILGSVWVYELYEPNYDPELGPYCNKTLYLFAYWLITSVYVFLAFITFCVSSLALTTFWLCPQQARC